MLRTSAELREVIRKNPFAKRGDIDAKRLLVIFLAGQPGAAERKAVLGIQAGTEELRIGQRELYVHYTEGMARPKLSLPALEKTLRTRGTGRNWNTVRKLLEIAEGVNGGI